MAHNLFGFDESMVLHLQLRSHHTVFGINTCFSDDGLAFSPTTPIEIPDTSISQKF